jgi:DNA-binding LacI/PurR family transcriptional regulator
MFRYQEIKNRLMAEIAKMDIKERLPSRPKLCEKLDTNRTTLDKAIKELVAEGLLYSKDGSGTYVAGGNDESAIHKGNWGVIVHDVTDVFYAELVRGVENFAQSHGINIILCNSDSDSAKQEQYLKRLIHSGVSGLIVVPVESRDIRENYRLYSQLTELKVPFVFYSNRNTEGIDAPVVVSDNYYGGYLATKHLLEKGYRNIAYISHLKHRASIDRCQGYIAALQENGVEVNRKIIAMETHSSAQPYGYEAMKKVLASGQLVDAAFCFCAKVTEGVYQAIAEAGLKVSDDIGVVGYDNSEICEKLIPAATVVDLKNLEIGAKTAEVLYKQINKEDLSDFEFYQVSPVLVVRDSCLGLKNRREVRCTRQEEGVGCG